MRTSHELDHLREQAVALRRQGKSRRQIMKILGPMSNSTLNDALKGEPPPEWTRRPNAKDDLRAKARELRVHGMDYQDIAAALGVAKSSVSLWVRDLPTPARLSYAECRKRSAEGARRYWAAERPAREALRIAAREAAAAEIGELTNRELLIAGAIAYWCEGSKNKPGPWNDQVIFTNSDPGLIRFFLRFLEAIGTSLSDAIFRVYIHESADVESAQRFWLEVTGASADQFRTPYAEAPQPEDGTEEHRRRVPRLPAHRRPAEQRPLPPDRGMVSSDHERRLTPAWAGVEPSYCSRGRIRTFVNDSKDRRPA